VKGADSPEAPSIGGIADALKLRHHSAVELVDRAVAAGLVIRQADPKDGRCQRLRLTPLGDERLAKLAALHLEELRRFRDESIMHLEALDHR
jgi:DNA-binding MarR family transcriptional regulator